MMTVTELRKALKGVDGRMRVALCVTHGEGQIALGEVLTVKVEEFEATRTEAEMSMFVLDAVDIGEEEERDVEVKAERAAAGPRRSGNRK